MKELIRKIIKEEVNKGKWEYHLRYIDGIQVYKRKVGDDKWLFANPEEFVKNAHKVNIVKYD